MYTGHSRAENCAGAWTSIMMSARWQMIAYRDNSCTLHGHQLHAGCQTQICACMSQVQPFWIICMSVLCHVLPAATCICTWNCPLKLWYASTFKMFQLSRLFWTKQYPLVLLCVSNPARGTLDQLQKTIAQVPLVYFMLCCSSRKHVMIMLQKLERET